MLIVNELGYEVSFGLICTSAVCADKTIDVKNVQKRIKNVKKRKKRNENKKRL